MGKLEILGVSSGGGVSLYPFKNHKILANVEIRAMLHTPGNIQWYKNFKNIPLFKKWDSNTIQFLKSYKRKVDVMVCSPDCGSGSLLRFSRAKKLGDHTKNKSLNLVFLSKKLLKPKFILFENLDGLFKSFPRKRFYKIFSDYRLIEHIAPVSRWGNSQIHRKRLIIVGIRKDLDGKIDGYFKLPNYGDRVKTCYELYGDLKIQELETAHISEDVEESISIYAGRKMKILDIIREWNTRLVGLKRWTVTDRKFTTAPGVYRNRKQDYPATARKANRQFDHDGLMMSPRQLARVQGVPDDFIIHFPKDGSKTNYWINKGRALVTKTPPYEISVWFKKKLIKTKKLGLWK